MMNMLQKKILSQVNQVINDNDDKNSDDHEYYKPNVGLGTDVQPIHESDRRKYDRFKVPKNEAIDKVPYKEQVPSINEMELFAMETRAKRKVTKLINPVIGQIQIDRQHRAQIEVVQDKLMQRVEALEQMVGSSSSMIKPKYAEELDSRVSNLKAYQKTNFEDLIGKLTLNNLYCTKLEARQKNIEATLSHQKREINGMMEQTRSLDGRLKKLNTDMNKLRHDFEVEVNKLKQKLDKELELFKFSDQNTKQSLKDFNAMLVNFEESLTKARVSVNIHEKQLNELYEVKLDTITFEQKTTQLDEKIYMTQKQMNDNYAQ